MRVVPFLAAAMVLILGSVAARAEPTEITVRVLSKDAKFIGTSMGGMRVTLRDAETRELLAEGVTRGGTGDTGRIMHTDGGRRARLADDGAAAFTAMLDLDRPRLIEAEAFGPLDHPRAAHGVTASQWVVPGRDLSVGDGWVLELPGFVVGVVTPDAEAILPSDTDGVAILANVTMMCGCPIQPGGLWDADNLEVAALVHRDGGERRKIALDFAGQASRFAATAPIDGPGVYDLLVYAYDKTNGNTGVRRMRFVVAD